MGRLLLLAACLATAWSVATADPPPATEADLDEVAAALRVLVADPDWNVEFESDPRRGGVDTWGRDGDEDAKALLAGWQDGRTIRARLLGEGEEVVAMVHRFATAGSADAAVRAARRRFEELDRELAGHPELASTSAYEEGAGPEGRLTGFRNVRTLTRDGKVSAMDTQAFSRGNVMVLLLVIGVPALNRAAQDAVLAYADGFLADPVAARAMPRPSPPEVESRGVRLLVRVVGPDGIPIPRASAGLALERRPWSATVRDGVAEFRRPPGERVRVFVWGARDAAGDPLPLAPANRADVGPEETEVTFRLEAGVGIAGRVTDARGAGLAGARVAAEPNEDIRTDVPVAVLGVLHGAAVTDAEGAYRIVGLAPIRYRLHVRPPGASDDALTVEADGGDGDRRIVVADLANLRVTVLDPSDHPVRGARLWAYASGGAAGTSHRSAVSDADGVATLEGMEPGRSYHLKVRAPADREDLTHIEEEAWPQEPTTLRLSRGWTLRGKVVDPGNDPTRAVVRRDGADFAEVERTGADGAFTLRHLPWGPVRVTARDAEDPFRSDEDVWVEASPGGPEVVLTLTPRPATGRVRLRVVDAEGRPVPRAMARVWDAEETDEKVEVLAGELAGAEPIEVRGAYAVEVWGAASADGRCLGLGPTLVEGLDAADPGTVVRLAPGLAVTGRVTATDGKPVAGVLLEALPPSDSSWLLDVLGTERVRHAWTESGPDGSFRLEGVGPGAYEVRVVAPPPHADPESVSVVAPAEGLTVVLPRGGRLTVRDWNGDPVSGARIQVRRRREEGRGSDAVLSRVTDGAGEAWIRAVAGRSDLNLSVYGPREREDCGSLDLDPWPRGLRVFQLPRTFTLRGVVRGPEGPVWFARIERAAPDDDAKTESLGRSDLQGRFEERGVPYAPLRIRAVTGGSRGEPERASPWVEVGPGAAPVELRIPAGG